MKKWIKVIVPLIILASLIVWRLEQSGAKVAGDAAKRAARSSMPASVDLVSPQIRDIISVFETTGTVEPIQNVKITPKVTGRIEFLKVREGDHVKQGQLLVRIDQSQVQADVRQQQAAVAEARYRLAQAQLTQSATDTSVTSQVRQQRANLGSAQAALRQAETAKRAQYESADASLGDAQSKIESANATVSNAAAAIRSAQANLDNANAKYQRTLGLYKQGYVAAQDVDDEKTAASVQQASLDTAKGQLDSANAALKSADMQKRSVEQQGNITRAKADADLEVARAGLTQAKASLDIALANIKQSPAYRQSLAALQSNVDAAKASLDSSVSKRQDTVLQSPLDGVVTARNMDLGSMASPGLPILTVEATNQVWITASVPGDVCAKLHINDPTNATFDALNGRMLTARIAQINPSADLQSRQYTVRAIRENTGNQLLAGMFAHVSFTTGKVSGALAVPREAIKQNEDGSQYVIIAGKDNKAKYNPVVTGASDPTWVQIISGLMPSQKVVTMSASSVREGQTLASGKTGQRGRGGRGRKP